ncbi:MAG: hypothetical protein IJ193_01740, partial [Bacilli bacterium]|nr:hypothetical protein [Bacilli bacterium]
MRKRSKTVKLALIAILFSIFGVLNVNAASNANYEMQLQKVNGLGITTKPSESIDSVQSMAITRNHFVFVMANSKDDNAKNIFYVMSK